MLECFLQCKMVLFTDNTSHSQMLKNAYPVFQNLHDFDILKNKDTATVF